MTKRFIKDKKISIYREESERLPSGNKTVTDVLVAGNIWAYVRQLSQDQLWKAAGMGMSEEMLFKINYRTDIDVPGYSVVYRGKKYKITRIDTFEGYKEDLTLYAEQGKKI